MNQKLLKQWGYTSENLSNLFHKIYWHAIYIKQYFGESECISSFHLFMILTWLKINEEVIFSDFGSWNNRKTQWGIIKTKKTQLLFLYSKSQG